MVIIVQIAFIYCEFSSTYSSLIVKCMIYWHLLVFAYLSLYLIFHVIDN